VSSWFWCL